MLIGRHYQNAYVTHDLDKARDVLRKRAVIRLETEYEGKIPIQTASGETYMDNRLALLWIGDLQVELIQPVGGEVGFYRDALPRSGILAFHHIAMRVPDWDGFRAGLDNQPYPLVFEGEAGSLKFLYLDARAELGHYLEYTSMPDEVWAGMGGR